MVNMFAGVGMFSIMAAKKKKCTVYSLDLNPVASKLCERNIAINKLAGEIISINGDASKIIQEQLIDKSDRTLTLLPERSDEFLDSAISMRQKVEELFTITLTSMQIKNQKLGN